MAPGGRRLGPVLIEDVLAALRVLDSAPSPRGAELATAQRLQRWAAARWPALDWVVEPVGERGANLVASHGPGPLLYSHLDTSLDGSARDALVTGRAGPVGPLRVADGWVDGFGLGVARAPAAAALVAFAGAGSGRLLLAGSGTHRRGDGQTGVEAYLARHPAPPSAVVAKCGPSGPLWEEPGAAYLTVRVAGRSGAALAPDSASPSGGVVQHAGVVLDAMAAWRVEHLRQRGPGSGPGSGSGVGSGSDASGSGQVGPACGIGAVRAGWPDKPDLLPATLEVAVYLVTVPGESVAAVAGELERQVRAVCAAGPLAGCEVDVDVEIVHAAAATPPDAPIVTAAVRAWTAEFGAPATVTGWAGSTDGVVLRAAGVPTVRLGPVSRPEPDDARRDRFALDELAAFVRVYRSLLSS